MQTFLPYPDFDESARCLDQRRLGKQRVEALQIHSSLTIRNYGGWRNHPATLMWEGYEDALKLYHDVMIIEWIERGFKNNMSFLRPSSAPAEMPPWLGDDRLHSSHRAALLHKEFEHYADFGWDEEPRMDYFWPTAHKEYA